MSASDRQHVAHKYVVEHGLTRTTLTAEHLRILYLQLKLSSQIIANEFGCRDRTVLRWLKKYSVKTRGIGEARSIQLNSHFFQSWSAEMAWVLGLCFTDGSFERNRVRLALIDRETLQKVRTLVGPYLTIYERPQSYDKQRTIYSLTFGNEEMAGDLQNLGLTSRKSLTMSFPTVPHQHVRHFIRGCWDGDGGFSFAEGRLFAHYTCGSLSFIEQLSEELFKADVYRRILVHRRIPKGVLRRRHSRREWEARLEEMQGLRISYGEGPYPVGIYRRKNVKAYDMRLKTDDQLLALYNFLYEGVDSSILMTRKYEMLRGYLKSKNLIT